MKEKPPKGGTQNFKFNLQKQRLTASVALIFFRRVFQRFRGLYTHTEYRAYVMFVDGSNKKATFMINLLKAGEIFDLVKRKIISKK